MSASESRLVDPGRAYIEKLSPITGSSMSPLLPTSTEILSRESCPYRAKAFDRANFANVSKVTVLLPLSVPLDSFLR